MNRPENVKTVQRFIGLATYLSRFLPHLSEICEPLRRLRDKGALYTWQSQQEEAFQNVKRLVSHQPVLKYYNVHEEVTIQFDASEVGLPHYYRMDDPLHMLPVHYQKLNSAMHR